MSSVGARDDGTTAPTGLVLVTESRAIIAAKVIDLPLFGRASSRGSLGAFDILFSFRVSKRFQSN